MCYRYSNDQEEADFRRVRTNLRLKPRNVSAQSFRFYHTNGFSFQSLPVITQDKPDEIQFFKWGLIPTWVKDVKKANELKKMTLNATAEGVFEKPSFKGSIYTRRCLVPATGFFEFHHKLGATYPYHVMVKDDNFPDSTRGFCFGGIASSGHNPVSNEVENTFSIITTPANEKMEFIHNEKKRMPMILHLEDEHVWLTDGLDKSHIEVLMQPYPSSHIIAHTVSKLLTSRKVDVNVRNVIIPEDYEDVPDWV